MTEPTSTAEHWDAAYQARATDGSSWWQPRDQLWTDLLDVAGATEGSRVIDVGAGASLVVDELVRRGAAHVVVLDLSETALQVVRDRLRSDERVTYVVGDVRSYAAEPKVDVWHDRAVLHFLVDADDRAAYHRSLIASVRVGGRVVLATFAEDGPTQCSGLPVRRSSTDDLADFLGPSFDVLLADRRLHTTPGGGAQQFAVVVAERIG